MPMPLTIAQQTCTQPMLSISWTNQTVLVRAPSTPSWPLRPLENAMQDWNLAQEWFLHSYEPTHHETMYSLKLAQPNQSGQVIFQYVPDTEQNWSGYASNDGKLVSIVLSRFSDSSTSFSLEILEEHELGHVLGLGDNCVGGDLMRGTCNGILVAIGGRYPSTLDLYGTYLQAATGNQYTSQDSVTLPEQIPYSTWHPNESPIPEFPNIFLVFASAMLLLSVIGSYAEHKKQTVSFLQRLISSSTSRSNGMNGNRKVFRYLGCSNGILLNL